MIQTKEATLHKYPAYKDSGVKWLGEIPEHWEVKKLKYLGSIYPGLSGKKGDDFSKNYKVGFKPFVPFTNIFNNLKINNNEFQFVKIEKAESQNRVQKNDILFLMSSETLEDIGKCSLYDGKNIEVYLNSFCKGFRFKPNELSAYFINYLLQGEIYRNYFSMVGRGFTRINIKQEYINDLLAILPPLPEQTAIATFLDDKTTKIDTAIAQKEKMIELLKERKQINIQDLVTGKRSMVNDEGLMVNAQWGVTPKEKMKDSGVEWIGEIPEDWEVKRLKYCLKVISEKIISKDSDFIYLGMENIESKTGNRIGVETETEGLSNKFNEGDVLFGKLRPYLAKVYLADFEGVCSTEFIVYRTEQPQYFHKLLLSNAFINFVDSSTYGAKMPRANGDWIGQQFIPVPPKEEQNVISNYIDVQSAKINQAISLHQTQIEKLKEYKSTLIDSAVTGKIRVGVQ